MALLFLISCNKQNIENKKLIIYNNTTDSEIAKLPINAEDFFSIEFIHSVNKSPVIDYYRFNEKNRPYDKFYMDAIDDIKKKVTRWYYARKRKTKADNNP